MDRVRVFFFIGAVILGQASSQQFLGCKYDPQLCQVAEVCVDDNLFGQCQSEPFDPYQYHLNEVESQLLRLELARLVEEGQEWDSLAVQCLLAYSRLVHRQGLEYDPEFCRVQSPGNVLALIQMVAKELNTPRDDDGGEERGGLAEVRLQDAPGEEDEDGPAELVAIPLPVEDEEDETEDAVSKRNLLSQEEEDLLNRYVLEVINGRQPDVSILSDKQLEKFITYVTLLQRLLHEEMTSETQGEVAPEDESNGEDVDYKNLFKKDEETVGIIDQGIGNTEHRIVPRPPEMPALSPVEGAGEYQANNVLKRTSVNEHKKVTEGEEENEEVLLPVVVVCLVLGGVLVTLLGVYVIQRRSRTKRALRQLSEDLEGGPRKDYEELCRQMMSGKGGPDSQPPEQLGSVGVVAQRLGSQGESKGPHSARSSNSSWSEEPVHSNLDISTGHTILAYMEAHLQNKEKLEEEWNSVSGYKPEDTSVIIAQSEENLAKNRNRNVLPYDHCRIKLSTAANPSGSDFINASPIADSDPRNPVYIAAQTPLPQTVADFWQMVWEQGAVVLVDLGRVGEGGETHGHRYWPENGAELFNVFEVHLVSEHIWCEDYLVRSFYLKNLRTGETRTVTQFHFLSWPDQGVPSGTKALLEFRRKVNKSYRGRSCPIVVQCSDGAGRTGTYCLLDMVLNRLNKGVKEVDIAATLEHIRDQRMAMVQTKEQFSFVLTCIAEEVQAILKALPQ